MKTRGTHTIGCECLDCRYPVNAAGERICRCDGCGDEIGADSAAWHDGLPFCAACDAATEEPDLDCWSA